MRYALDICKRHATHIAVRVVMAPIIGSLDDSSILIHSFWAKKLIDINRRWSERNVIIGLWPRASFSTTCNGTHTTKWMQKHLILLAVAIIHLDWYDRKRCSVFWKKKNGTVVLVDHWRTCPGDKKIGWSMGGGGLQFTNSHSQRTVSVRYSRAWHYVETSVICSITQEFKLRKREISVLKCNSEPSATRRSLKKREAETIETPQYFQN